MKVLELFAGSRSVGKVAEGMGHDVFSVDKFITEQMGFVGGVEELSRELIIEGLNGEPDMVWASPVCSAWSKTGWFHYWDTDIYRLTNQFIHKRPYAIESIEMVRKTIEIFSWFPNAVLWMENPEGMLQMHPVISYFKVYGLSVRKHTVTYCQYGDTIRKPTNIWSNSLDWRPRAICSPGATCHTSSPSDTQRGIKTKTNAYERSRIPEELCREIINVSVGGVKIPSQEQLQLIA